MVMAMHVDTPEERVFECSAQVPFLAPRSQEPVVKAGSIFPRERVQRSTIDVRAHQIGGEIGKDTLQQCVADRTV